MRFSFEPADIVSEVMSFGSPTPVEFTVNGPNLAENRAYAEKVRAELAKVPSLRDLQFVQSLDYPTVGVQIDREKAGPERRLGRRGRALAGRGDLVEPVRRARTTGPTPRPGIGYQVQVEIPYQVMNSITEVETIPIQKAGGDPLLLRDVAKVSPGTMPGEYDRYNMKRVVSLTANISGEDLGRVAGHVDRAIARAGEPPKGATVEVRGQIAPMNEMLRGLAIGLGMAIVVILLLLTANFQSVRLALVVISTTPAVVAGVVVALWLTGTTVNIQSFMGAIMAIGVAVANAILLVTFAERHRRERVGPGAGGRGGGQGRLRPILMTSCAMIAGMVPMALGWSEGGEQTAPLGRAVIGGLAAATLATLVVLPTVFAIVQGGAARRSASVDPADPESSHYDPELWGGCPRHAPSNGEREGARTRPRPRSPGTPSDAGTLTAGVTRARATPRVRGTLPAETDHAAVDPSPTPRPRGDRRRSRRPPPAAARPPRPRRATRPARPSPASRSCGRSGRTVRRSTEQPGQIEAYEVTPIYAKVSGYVQKWNVDIGTKVTKGQVLAVLSVPETRRRGRAEAGDGRGVRGEARPGQGGGGGGPGQPRQLPGPS